MALNYYFKSKDIKVFPSSFRGESGGKTFDPESRLNTEANFIAPKTMLGKSTYIFGREDNIIKFVLGGYYFELDSTDYLDNLKGKTIGIMLREVKLNEATSNSYDSDRFSNVLDSWEAAASKTLDIADTEPGAADATYYFTGLKILSETDTPDFSIMLFDTEGNLNQEALLVDLKHGKGYNTLMRGEGLEANYYNQTVIGSYNENKEGSIFEIGKGSANNARANALEISATTTTINTVTNINGNTIITGNTKIDGTTEVTKTTKVKGDLIISNNTNSDSKTTGALKVAGGVGVSKNLNVGGDTNLNNKLVVKTSPADTETNVKVDGTLNVTGKTNIYNNVTVDANKTTLAKPVEITDTSDTALIVSGKTTVKKDLEVGDSTKVLTVNTDEQNVTVTGTLKSTDKATFGNGLEVESGKTTTLGGQVNITGKVNINTSSQNDPESITIHGNTSIEGATAITGAVTITGKATSTATTDADWDTTLTTKDYVDRKISDLDVFTKGADGCYIKTISETDGKIDAGLQEFDKSFDNATDNNAPTTLAIKNHVTTKINDLTVESEIGSNGHYLKTIKETAGIIDATPQAFDTEINDSSSDNNAPTSNAVKTYVDSKILNPIEPIMALQCSSSEHEIAGSTKANRVFSFTDYHAVKDIGVTKVISEKWLIDADGNVVAAKFNDTSITLNKVNSDVVDNNFYYWYSSSLTPLYTTTTKNTDNSKTTTGNFAIGLWIRFTDSKGNLKDWNQDDSALRINLENLIKNRLNIEYSTAGAGATVNSVASYTASQIEYDATNYPSEDWAIFAEPIGTNNKQFIYITRSSNDTRCRGFQVNIIVNASVSIPGTPAK